MKRKTRKLSIQVKILVPVALMIILIGVALGSSSYINIRSGMIEMGVEQADMAADTALEYIYGGYVEKITGSESVDSTEYALVLESVRNAQDATDIKYLYVLYTDGEKVYYGADADKTENQCMPGDVFEVPYEELADVFSGEEYVQDFIDHTDDGDLISVFKPILNHKGEVVGILGCDYDASNIVAKQNAIISNVLVIAVICLVVALVIVSLIVTSIVRNLRRVDEKIYDLVHNEGDLTNKLDIKTGDELENISNNVNQLLEYIRGIMLNIADDSLQISDSAVNVVHKLSEADTNITSVSATMEQMNAAMEETNASVTQIEEAIVSIYEEIESISGDANEGKTSSEEIIDRATEIHGDAEKSQVIAREQAAEMAASMNEKIEKSKAVEEITALTENIIEITEQTNLLALNAAIEAARAGEAGRGFAVVADQIGKLAADSAKSAVNTRELISKSLAEIEHGNEITTKTAAAIDKVVANMTEFAAAAKGSAQASRTQADMLKQVEYGIEQISGVVQNNSATAEETSAVSQELLAQSETLKNQVSQFNLKG